MVHLHTGPGNDARRRHRKVMGARLAAVAKKRHKPDRSCRDSILV